MDRHARSLREVTGPLVRWGVALAWVATFWGCGGSSSNLATVEGLVTLDGKPLTQGAVTFVPDAGRTAAGTIQSDGTFRLRTVGEGDGARVGMNQVSITAYDYGGQSGPNFDVDRPQAKSLIPLVYGSPADSGLTFDVKPGVTNHAEFHLHSNGN